MSIARLSAGPGYEYLLRHISRGDGALPSSRAMTRYYTDAGYPPGVWLGRGLAGLADGNGLRAGSVVSEEQMARLFGHAHDPVTDTVLGSEYVITPPLKQRIADAVTTIPTDLPAPERDARIAAAVAGEKAKPDRGSVAGFDLTFSVPKSVSVLWALADGPTQQRIVAAHHAAVATVIGLIERDVARTRTGHAGAARVPVLGLVAAGFDHHDSRAGDPQLHTHVTVANRGQAADRRWRTLDSQGLYAAAVAHSDTYDALLADNITRSLQLAWETRLHGRNRSPRRELAAIPDTLIEEFSQRSAAITAAKDDAIARFVAEHHRQPTGPEAVRIRQRATLATRTPKQATSLSEHLGHWADRAQLILGANPHTWTVRILGDAATASAVTRPAMVAASVVGDQAVEVFAAAALDEVEAKRATWSRWNLVAASVRALAHAGTQFATPRDLLAARDRVSQAAMQRSVLLNPTTANPVVDQVDATTGRAVTDRPEVFTSLEVLAAEDRLLAAGDDPTGPTVGASVVDAVMDADLPGRDHGLEPDQAAAVLAICTSGRVLDVLVGPAGTGKTTTMAGLREAWEAEHGPGTVVGLATSAIAAQVLGTEIRIVAENTAQWLAQQQLQPVRAARIAALMQRRDQLDADGASTSGIDRAIGREASRFDRWALNTGQLLVVDEAGMADLFTLDKLASQAKNAGAKILLVGDPAQLAAIGPGGTFGMLTRHRPDTPRLTGIRRFRDPDGTLRVWEAQASLQLRDGNPAAITAYQQHDRLHDGTTEEMIDGAYQAWRTDRANGLDSLLIAADNATVQALNLRAQADLVAAGAVRPGGVLLHDGTTAGVGDVIITRRVDRTIPDGTVASEPDNYGRLADGYIRNGTTLQITGVDSNGSLRARATDGADSVLPAGYVAEHVDLGYAITAHRAQGITVDTTHTVATPTMTREALYVALTRGTTNNHLYIATDHQVAERDHLAFGVTTVPGHSVARAILSREGAELSANDVATRIRKPTGSHHRSPSPA